MTLKHQGENLWLALPQWRIQSTCFSFFRINRFIFENTALRGITSDQNNFVANPKEEGISCYMTPKTISINYLGLCAWIPSYVIRLPQPQVPHTGDRQENLQKKFFIRISSLKGAEFQIDKSIPMGLYHILKNEKSENSSKILQCESFSSDTYQSSTSKKERKSKPDKF